MDHCLYVASSLTLVLLLFWYRDAGPEPPGLGRFWRHCLPRAVWAHPSTRLDAAFVVVNALVERVAVVPLLVASPWIAGHVVAVLQATLGEHEPAAGGLGAGVALTLALLLAADFGFYVSHTLQHRVGVLWEFHAVHHSAAVLTPLTAYRQHPVDDLIDGTLIALATGMVHGVAGYIWQGLAEPVLVLGANAGLVLFLFAGAHLRHSHVWLSYGPVLSRIFISPAQHQIHHSVDPRHVDRNFGGIFAIWDALFGTLYVPRTRETLTVGLADGGHAGLDSVARLYTMPFRRLLARIPAIAHGGAFMKRSCVVPVIALVTLALATTLSVHRGLAQPPAPGASRPTAVQPLKTAEGWWLAAEVHGDQILAFINTPQGRVLLADGQYKLANGGAIRVKDGRVVWDQFGIVEKFNQGQVKGLLGIG